MLIWVPGQRELRAAVDNQFSMSLGYSESENELARSEHERLPQDQVVPAEQDESELYVGSMQRAVMDLLLAEPFSNPEEPAITEAGVPDVGTRMVLQWASTYIFRLNLLAALLNRWGECFGLESRVMHYRLKPWSIMLGCGVPGIVLWVLQWWVPEFNAAAGRPFGEYSGWVRFGMMVIGSYLIFFAWPYWLRKGETPEQQEADFDATFAAHDEFHRKIRR